MASSFIQYIIFNKDKGQEVCTIEVHTPIQIDEQIEGLLTDTDVYIVKGLGRVKRPDSAQLYNTAWVLKLKD